MRILMKSYSVNENVFAVTLARSINKRWCLVWLKEVYRDESSKTDQWHLVRLATQIFFWLVFFLCTSGGAELLFDGVKEHHVTLPGQSEPCEYPNLSFAKGK